MSRPKHRRRRTTRAVRVSPRRALVGVVGLTLFGMLVGYAATLNVTSGDLTTASATGVAVPKSTPSVSTKASAGGVVPVAVSDTAKLTGGTANATGTLTFTLWGPNPTPKCTTKVGSSTVNVTAGAVNASYPSGTLTPTTAGTYYWTLSYSGDANNAPIPQTTCDGDGDGDGYGDEGNGGGDGRGYDDDNDEMVVIAQATPAITTKATPASLTVGGSVNDQAIVTGGDAPGGKITWTLYDNTKCNGSPVFTSSPQAVSGDNTYTSSPYITTSAGTFTWKFSYNGDTNNKAVTACGGTNETLVVNQATPGVGTAASASVAVGTSVTDTATLSNAYNPTGTITYTLYGPSPSPSCSGSTKVGQVTKTVSGNGTYTSPSITPTVAGTYWWIANYGGDHNNVATTNGCGATGESSLVNPVTPIVTTTDNPSSVTVGGSVADQATVAWGYSPGGTITWKLYPASDTTCAGTAVFTSGPQAVKGNSNYTSGAFTTTAAGNYQWGFAYSGDTNNKAVSGCGGTNETLTVNQASPTVVTVATPTVKVGQPISDTATLTGGYNATGTITFTLYGPASTAICSAQVGQVTKTVSGNGTYTSPSITPTVAGPYWWIANYGGDANNKATNNGCGLPLESSAVTSS